MALTVILRHINLYERSQACFSTCRYVDTGQTIWAGWTSIMIVQLKINQLPVIGWWVSCPYSLSLTKTFSCLLWDVWEHWPLIAAPSPQALKLKTPPSHKALCRIISGCQNWTRQISLGTRIPKTQIVHSYFDQAPLSMRRRTGMNMRVCTSGSVGLWEPVPALGASVSHRAPTRCSTNPPLLKSCPRVSQWTLKTLSNP